MYQFRVAVLFLLIPFLISASSFGQQNFKIVLDSELDGEEQLKNVLELVKTDVSFYLSNYLKEVNEVCDLDDSQIIKLKVINRKGVGQFVGNVEKAHRKRLNELQRQVGYELDDDGNLEWTGGPERVFSMTVSMRPSKEVLRLGRWRNQFFGILDNEQMEKWNAELSRETDVMVAAAVDFMMARISPSLFLTDQQRSQVREILVREYGTKLTRQLEGNVRFFSHPITFGDELKWDRPYEGKLRDILNEEQFSHWNTFVEPELESFK